MKSKSQLIAIVFASVVCVLAGVSEGSVGEWWQAEEAMPVDLYGMGVGVVKEISFRIERDLSEVGEVRLALVVDDIDSASEAVITFNGLKLEIPQSIIGEETGPKGAGHKGAIVLPLEKLKTGVNKVSFTFADNLGGSTGGYLILDAQLGLDVSEEVVDISRLRDVIPDLPAEHNTELYPKGLTGFAGLNRQQIVMVKSVAAKRTQIGPRGMYMTAIAELKSGELLACCNYRFEGSTWRVKIFRSADKGQSWTAERGVCAIFGRQPRLTILKNGGVLLTTWNRHKLYIYRSADGGVNWTATNLERPLRPCRNILENKDGSLSLLVSKGSYYNPKAAASKAWIYESRDHGASWSIKKEVSVWQNPEPMFDEGSVIRLKNGRLVATGRVTGNVEVEGAPLNRKFVEPLPWMRPNSVSPSDKSGDHMVVSVSSDEGQSWSEPKALTGYGEVHGHLLELADGRVVCTYVSGHLPFGVYAIISEDGGQNWDRDNAIQLAVSQDSFTAWPTSLQLGDRSVVTAYGITAYLEHEDTMTTVDTVAEVVRWRP